jgi:DNA recombination protein RmuC
MDATSIALLVLGAAAGAVVAALAARVRSPGAPAAETAAVRAEIGRLAERVSAETTALAHRLEGIDARMMQTQSSNADLARGIFETLGDVRRATTSVAEQAREFGALQDLLRAPKARGGLGEALLEELLRQVLPPGSFSTQHRFSSGVVVDAVVRAGGRMVCIDSKFPLANYHRMCDATEAGERQRAERSFAADVETHIRAISSRYVVPDEGTFDFAVMYVPAEGIYGEILRLHHRKRPLPEIAIGARVVPMSPLTMYGYLQTVLFGLKCLSIEKSAEAILDFCGRLGQDMERFATDYATLGRHLANARSKYEDGTRRLERVRDRLDRVVELAPAEAGRASLEAVND